MTDALPIVVAVTGLCGSFIAILSFWMNFATKIANANTDSQHAKKSSHEANEKVVLLSASFALYREQIAREYIHREVMREVEERLTAAIDRLGDRLDRVLEKSGSN